MSGWFVNRDPIGYADGFNLYGAYFVPDGFDPSGLEEYEGLPTAGTWQGKPGDSRFIPDDLSIGFINYNKGIPDLSPWYGIDPKTGKPLFIEIKLNVDPTKTPTQRSRSDRDRARRAAKNAGFQDKGYDFHHLGYDPKTGLGTMVPVEERPHEVATHDGPRKALDDLLDADAKRDIPAKRKAARRLKIFGKLCAKALVYWGAWETIQAGRQGWADDGSFGAANAMIQDAMMAEELESLGRPIGDAIARPLTDAVETGQIAREEADPNDPESFRPPIQVPSKPK